MFAYELPLNPSCDEWIDYICPEICRQRIEEICHDILKRGDKTHYNKIYDAIYELVQADIEDEHLENYC